MAARATFETAPRDELEQLLSRLSDVVRSLGDQSRELMLKMPHSKHAQSLYHQGIQAGQILQKIQKEVSRLQ